MTSLKSYAAAIFKDGDNLFKKAANIGGEDCSGEYGIEHVNDATANASAKASATESLTAVATMNETAKRDGEREPSSDGNRLMENRELASESRRNSSPASLVSVSL